MARALVTGAGKRIGRAIALALARRGYDVAVHYAGSGEAAEAVAAEIRAMGRNAALLRADLLQEDAAAGLVPAAMAALDGPLAVLVNNASIFEHDTIETATRLSWDRHIESNLRAPFVLTQAMAEAVPAPVPDAAGEPVAQGLVVNMIDQRVRRPTPDFISYMIAKSALWTLTQTTAQALAPRVRVNAIGPGPTLQGAHQTADQFARQREATLLQRGVNLADITAALAYFIDANAVTGQLICVDGGRSIDHRLQGDSGFE